MFLTPHVLTGAAVASATGNIPLTIGVAFFSHFVLDAFPHTDWSTWHDYKEGFRLKWYDYLAVSIDLFVSLITIIYIYRLEKISLPLLLAGVLFATLVDWIDNVPFWSPYLRKFFPFDKIHLIHKKIGFVLNKKYWLWGIMTQIIICGGALWFLL